MKKRLTALITTVALLCTGGMTGCVTADPSSDGAGRGITVAISSDTGTMDPAGSIALTYLAY